MAKKKIAPLPPLDDDDDDDLIPEVTPAPRAPDGGDDGAGAELAAVLAELGGMSDASISVNKVGLQGEERLGKFMPREFDVDSLKDRYGGGVYWIYVHVGGKLHTKRRVVFARSLDEQRGGVDGKAGAALSSENSMAAALERMAQQNREMLQTMVQLVTANRSPATDPMMIISAAEKLANLGNRGNGGDDLERLMRFAKFSREFGGGSDSGEPGIAAMAMEFFKSFREFAHQPPPQPQLAAPGASQSSPGDPQQMMLLIRRALAERLPLLIRGAQAESDPGVYAQLVLDQLPELYLAPMLRELAKPEWFTLLVQVDGRVVPYQAWFEALRNELLQATSPPESPAT